MAGMYDNSSMDDIRKDIEALRILGRPVQDMFLAMVDRAHALGYQEAEAVFRVE